MPRGVNIPVSEVRLAWLREQRPRLTDAQLAAAWRALWGEDITSDSLSHYCRRHGIRRKPDGGRFRRGAEPWNKGLTGYQAGGRSAETRFQRGASPHTTLPVGSYRQDKDGIWLLKVSDRDPARADAPNARLRDWRYVHRLTWEAHHGPIPLCR